jgi:metal-responsive CopG/Arc/MetJ family transcriptional regulator
MKYHPIRSKESVQISITVPKELLQKIDDITLLEDRNRSNMITVILKSGIANYNAKAAAQATKKDEPAEEAK